jgi:excisionase family DNA binding protein
MPAAVTNQTRQVADPEAFSVAEFAQAYRVSRATVYNMWRDGEGPARMRVRGRVLISRDAAEKWRASVEQEAA